MHSEPQAIDAMVAVGAIAIISELRTGAADLARTAAKRSPGSGVGEVVGVRHASAARVDGEGRVGAELGGELRGRLVGQERDPLGDRCRELQRLLGVEVQPQSEEHVRQAHAPQPDRAPAVGTFSAWAVG